MQDGLHFIDGILEINFIEWKILFSFNLHCALFPTDPIRNKSTLVQAMTSRQMGDIPSHKPRLAYISDAYMFHSAPTWCKL